MKSPALLDHILLGCNDRDRGIAFVEERTNVRAAFGGVHPGRGTRNTLLSLGERRYLEIIAPDPKQGSVQRYAAQLLTAIKELTTPHLVGWAAHPGEIEAFAKKQQKPSSHKKRSSTKSVLRLPDLEHAKFAVLNSPELRRR